MTLLSLIKTPAGFLKAAIQDGDSQFLIEDTPHGYQVTGDATQEQVKVLWAAMDEVKKELALTQTATPLLSPHEEAPKVE